jgi:hypothetical protein
MCRWHKEAIKRAATNPETGEFNVGQYAVGITAMALFRIEQKKWNMPEIFEIDGFNPEELLTPEAKAAYQRSNLEAPINEVNAVLDKNVELIRAALRRVESLTDLSKDALNINDNIGKDGYKATCCAPADPRENGPFLDAAVVNLCKGYDDEATRFYASNELELITSDELLDLQDDKTVAEHDRPYIGQLEGLRTATQMFLEQEGIKDVLEETFQNSISYIFQTAQHDLDNGLGLRGASNCIMCEGVKGRKATQNTPK